MIFNILFYYHIVRLTMFSPRSEYIFTYLLFKIQYCQRAVHKNSKASINTQLWSTVKLRAGVLCFVYKVDHNVNTITLSWNASNDFMSVFMWCNEWRCNAWVLSEVYHGIITLASGIFHWSFKSRVSLYIRIAGCFADQYGICYKIL